MDTTDCIVIGAGVVGLACARAMANRGLDVIVVEKEGVIGSHTSSRNSEVIHAGIYYPRESLKARLCVSGRDTLYDYCQRKGIGHKRLGKLIVASSEAQVAALAGLRERALANGVADVRMIAAAEARRMEPAVRCVAAMLSPSTGIVDSHEFMTALVGDIENAGGAVVCDSAVTAIDRRNGAFEVTVGGEYGVRCQLLINSAGLWASSVASLIGDIDSAAVPDTRYAIGHYFSYAGRSPFSRLIYPMPVSAGLGIHATLDMSGAVRFGPDVSWVDRIDYAFDESRHDLFCEAIADYFPDFEPGRLVPAYTGIRPKIAAPGDAAADFVIQGPEEHGLPGLVNLFGIESPGLTSSLAIAETVAAALGR